MTDLTGRVTTRSCCCLGFVDNCDYKCMSRALDWGHCTPESDCYAACMKRLAEYPRAFRRKAGIKEVNRG